MGDVAFILTVLGFFAVCVAYVRGCERLVRSGEERPASGEVLR